MGSLGFFSFVCLLLAKFSFSSYAFYYDHYYCLEKFSGELCGGQTSDILVQVGGAFFNVLTPLFYLVQISVRYDILQLFFPLFRFNFIYHSI